MIHIPFQLFGNKKDVKINPKIEWPRYNQDPKAIDKQGVIIYMLHGFKNLSGEGIVEQKHDQ